MPLALRFAPGCFASSSLRSVRTSGLLARLCGYFEIATGKQRIRQVALFGFEPESPLRQILKNPHKAGFFVSGGEGGIDCAAVPLALRFAPGCFASSSLRSGRTSGLLARLGGHLQFANGKRQSGQVALFGFEPRSPSPPGTKKPARRRVLLYLAERGGFEPPKGRKPLNGFRDRRIRPLCHLSETIKL